MYRKLVLTGLLATSLLTILIFYALASAAPMPQRPVVNHQTRQCALIVPGDECGDVILPSGWEYLDEAKGEKCPDDYAAIELYSDWAPFKVPHCCTDGHSGSAGDCQDVVINQSNHQCAFVDDIHNCPKLPSGWNVWGKNCPNNFGWVEEVSCSGNQAGTTKIPTLPSQIEITSTSLENGTTGGGRQIGTLEPAETATKPDSALPCPSVAMVLVGLVGIGFWQKRTNG